MALPQKVVINSPGVAAKDLWRDKTIIPVRGQTGFLIPQPDCHYSVNYKGVQALSKSDGVKMSNNSPVLGDMEGVGVTRELPDVPLMQAGIAILAPLFASMKSARA